MNKKVFGKIPNWIKLFAILILLIAVGYGVWFFVGKSQAKPPVEFLTARQRGAEISQKIIELTSDTHQKIEEIDSLDLNGDYVKALDLIERAKNKNQETLEQAIKLTNEVQKMLESLEKISSPKNREIAVKAINLETSLIINFIDYNHFLDQFLNNLYKAIATSKYEYRQAATDNLVELEIRRGTINNLNQQFLEEMGVFDKAFSK